MNVPQLRFEGFDGEWKQQELSELLEFKNGINADKDSYGHGAKFINVLDILKNDYILSKNIIGSVNATEQQLKTYSVTYGDILFLRSSETREDVGKCNVYLDEEKPAVFGGFVIRGKKNADYSPFFLKTLLNNSSARDQISSKAGGSTRYNVGQGILSEVKIKVPNIAEQEKISSFLMLLNQRIKKQKEKIEKQEQFKKGMMQKVFSQELRFKDEGGNVYPDFVAGKLGDHLIHLGSGVTPRGGRDVYTDSGVFFIRSQNVYNTGLILDDIAYISEEVHKKMKNSKVFSNDVLLNITGASIGRTALVPKDFPEANVNQHVCIIRTKSNILPAFLKFYLESTTGQKLIFQDQAGQTREALNLAQIKAFKVFIPTLKEQMKISNYISKIEMKIDKEKEKLMVLEEQKRGFMQGMFI